MEIVALAARHEGALERFVADFRSAGETTIPAYFVDDLPTMTEKVEQLAAWSRGEVPEGWVPTTTRFLEHDGELLGVYNVRHGLNARLEVYGGHVGYSVRPSARRQGHATRLLRHALGVGGTALGLDRMLLTCNETNTGSRHVIEACGGVFWDTFFYEPKGAQQVRYWVPTNT